MLEHRDLRLSKEELSALSDADLRDYVMRLQSKLVFTRYQLGRAVMNATEERELSVQSLKSVNTLVAENQKLRERFQAAREENQRLVGELKEAQKLQRAANANFSNCMDTCESRKTENEQLKGFIERRANEMTELQKALNNVQAVAAEYEERIKAHQAHETEMQHAITEKNLKIGLLKGELQERRKATNTEIDVELLAKLEKVVNVLAHRNEDLRKAKVANIQNRKLLEELNDLVLDASEMFWSGKSWEAKAPQMRAWMSRFTTLEEERQKAPKKTPKKGSRR